VSAMVPRANSKSEPGDAGVQGSETDVVLKDGSLAHVRPVRSDDRTAMLELIKILFAEALYLRFLHTMSPEEAVKWLMPGAGCRQVVQQDSNLRSEHGLSFESQRCAHRNTAQPLDDGGNPRAARTG